MDLRSILEAILFSSQKSLSSKELKEVLVTTAQQTESEAVPGIKSIRESEVSQTLESMRTDYQVSRSAYILKMTAGARHFVSREEYAPWIRTLLGKKNRPPRLSLPALETLAIIAYRQPLTRSEMEQIRGVSVDGVMQTLLERGSVEKVGQADVVGKPTVYGTTTFFEEYFGLSSLDDLPEAEELRRIEVDIQEALEDSDAQTEDVESEESNGEDQTQNQDIKEEASSQEHSPVAEGD